jgi:L-ascorbate metabolism protein UlaG (beta-lactamase superfamily)
MMNITWLGQAGFVFEAQGYRLVVDPYLSDSCARHSNKD